jgi:23S rRNA maturation mini-RNase III
MSYKLSTAFEALVGYLFMRQEQERAEQIMAQAMQLIDSTEEKAADLHDQTGTTDITDTRETDV